MGGISDFVDKVTPNEVTSFMNSAADKLMPKELAPYSSYIAPFLVPFIGAAGAHAFAQLGSAKQNDGQLDPFAALAVYGASNTDAMKAKRLSYDSATNTGGTLGQRGAGKISNLFGDGMANNSNAGLDNMLSRGFDPTKSMFNVTSDAYTGFGGNKMFDGMNMDKYKYMENSSGILEGMKNAVDPSQYNQFMAKYSQLDPTLTGADLDKVLREGMDPVKATTTSNFKDDPKKIQAWSDKYNNGVLPSEKELAVLKQNGANFGQSVKVAKVPALPGSDSLIDIGTKKAVDFAMPAFEELQTGQFAKLGVIETITSLGTITTLGGFKEAEKKLKEKEFKNQQEKDAVLRTFFDQYEAHGNPPRKYDDPRYARYKKDPELMAHYKRLYGSNFANGGRVNYNMGGDTGIMAAPGVPDGMQLDGRVPGGTFVSQGIAQLADDVPAMLSKDEFVITAKGMEGFDKMTGGNGEPRAAAKKMYQLMEQMEAMA